MTRFSLTAPPTWSMWPWVMMICLRVSLCLVRRVEYFGDVFAGVDDDRFARDLVAEDGAIAAQHSDWEGFKNHGAAKRASPIESRYLAGLPGVAGAVDAGTDLVPESTERGPLWRAMSTKSPIEVNMKTMADQVVSRVSRLAAPRGPKAV